MVDFWGPDCAPCRIIAPILEDLAAQHGHRVGFFSVNVDENPELPLRFGVMGIPTVLFLRDGLEGQRIVGAASRARFEAALQRLLA